MSEPGSDRFPRGAILVVVIGLLATALVAWVSDEDLITSKPLPWLESHPEAIADVGPKAFGADGEVALSSTGFDTSGVNSAGYRLFQVGGELTIDPGSFAGAMTVTCSVETETPTVNARTPSRPAAFPGPVENLEDAAWPGDVIVDYSAQGSPYSTVTLPTAYMGYGGFPGVSLEWGDWEAGSQTWIWRLSEDREQTDARLRFVSLWRTFEEIAIEMRCEASGEGGPRVVLATGGSLGA